MTDRVLPYEEWGRLAGTALGSVASQLNPATTQIAVVEDDAGQIVGCWAACTVVHAEGAWIAPAYRKRASVTVRLWRRMRHLIRAAGASGVVTGAESPEVVALLERTRAQRLPQEYLLCL